MGVKKETVEGIDLQIFAEWANINLPELGSLTGASLLSGGHSNLNILLNFDSQKIVLRRPPLGHIMEGAHNMGREFQALSALSGTTVPVAKPIYVQAETNVATGVDAPFFLMEFAAGQALNSKADNAGKTKPQLLKASHGLARTLANLHALEPQAIGLGEFGRPEGYLARQVKIWGRQLEASRSRETPLLDELMRILPDAPVNNSASVVHGDYKMNNALINFAAETPKIAAILDWEMATLGDPYSDLAMFGMYWSMPDKHEAIKKGFISPVDLDAGYPKFAELLETYEAASGKPLPNMDWYWAFAALKIGAITESLHYRYHIGAARGEGFELMADMTEPIAKIGLDALDGKF